MTCRETKIGSFPVVACGNMKYVQFNQPIIINQNQKIRFEEYNNTVTLFVCHKTQFTKDESKLIELCQNVIDRQSVYNRTKTYNMGLPVYWSELDLLKNFLMQTTMNSDNENIAALFACATMVLVDQLSFNLKKLYLQKQSVIWVSLSEMGNVLNRIKQDAKN